MGKNTKNKKETPSRLCRNWVSIVIIVISLVGVCSMIACVILLCFGKIDSVAFMAAMESNFIETGLAVIGCALAVWAGANIVNAISRKDIESIKDNLGAAKEQLAEHQEQQVTYEKNLFISELLKSSVDLPTRLFAERVQGIKPSDWPDVPYRELLHIEQAFSQVFFLHESDNREGPDSNGLILQIAEDGINLAKELDGKNELPKEIHQFLKYRIAEFYFYKGYHLKGPAAVQAFAEAIPNYRDGVALFDAAMPVFDEEKAEFPITIDQECAEDKKAISAYMCNTLGTAYSKIIEQSNKHEESQMPDSVKNADKKALFYCAYAVAWNVEKRERYSRNYGCAIEHTKEDFLSEPDAFKKTRELYQEALDFSLSRGEHNWKPFHVWLSLYHKYSSKLLILDDLQYLPDPRTIFITQENVDYLLKYAERSRVYADMAVSKHPDILRFFKLRAFVYRDLAMLYRIAHDEKATAYCKLMGESVAVLKVLYSEEEKRDAYSRELIDQYGPLSSYIISENLPALVQVIINGVKVK